MSKRITFLALFVAALTVPAVANARTITGRVTSLSPTSISVFDKGVVTVGTDSRTTFSKLITQRPWQEGTSLPPNALRVGSYVSLHVSHSRAGVAHWVQVATDLRPRVPR